MKTVIEYLDDSKEKTGSDYMTAKKSLELQKNQFQGSEDAEK